MARSDRFERLLNRRVPMEKYAAQMESFANAKAGGQELSYLIDAMQPIDEEFTKNTFAEADRVKEQLKTYLPAKYLVEFDYQGSVTSDTHIRIHSDIDLLALHGGFVGLDAGVRPTNLYSGNSLVDLLSMRSDSATVLKSKFPAVKVDDKPGKAISLEGGSLARKIDLIIGNWWDTELWKQYRVKMARGIEIVDSKIPTTIRNKPFWHNYEIDQKDKKTRGLRKIIRLLKTLKYDAEPELKMSSYDIASIAWNMAEPALTVPAGAYTQLAKNARDELKRFVDNDSTRNSLNVPNGTRLVFADGAATVEQLRQLHKELSELIVRVEAEQYESQILNFSKSASTRKMPLWEERRPEIVIKNSF